MIWEFGSTPLDRFLRWLKSLKKGKKMISPTSCINCHESINPLNRPKLVQKLWQAYFLCDDCGRMTRITALIVTVLMAFLGWFI